MRRFDRLAVRALAVGMFAAGLVPANGTPEPVPKTSTGREVTGPGVHPGEYGTHVPDTAGTSDGLKRAFGENPAQGGARHETEPGTDSLPVVNPGRAEPEPDSLGGAGSGPTRPVGPVRPTSPREPPEIPDGGRGGSPRPTAPGMPDMMPGM